MFVVFLGWENLGSRITPSINLLMYYVCNILKKGITSDTSFVFNPISLSLPTHKEQNISFQVLPVTFLFKLSVDLPSFSPSVRFCIPHYKVRFVTRTRFRDSVVRRLVKLPLSLLVIPISSRGIPLPLSLCLNLVFVKKRKKDIKTVQKIRSVNG